MQEPGLRHITPMPSLISELPDLSPSTPTFEWIDPQKLLVDAAYQRDLTDRSRQLIQKIIRGWDWARFKPPIVAMTDFGLEVIDGQHTAIAAATHPEISTIPVMLIAIPEQGHRAAAFIGHNRDRVPITRLQMHRALVIAGESASCLLERICVQVGITLLSAQPTNGKFKPGETIALVAMEKLLQRRGAAGTRRVLQLLREAECTPVNAAAIKAVDMLLHDEEFCGQIDPDDIKLALRSGVSAASQAIKLFSTTHQIPTWKAYGITLFKMKRRASAASAPGRSAATVDLSSPADRGVVKLCNRAVAE